MEMQMKPFAFDDSLVRTYTDEAGDPWFVAKDVCNTLELGNVTEALRNIDEDEKFTLSNSEGNPREGIPHTLNLISESGLYSLVFRSRKPEAKRFRKWVTSEVLPTLRKTGSYTMGQEVPWTQMQAVRPAGRMRMMGLAVRLAQLDGAGSDAALTWFGQLCQMTGQDVSDASREVTEDVRAFAEECCAIHTGTRVRARVMYEAYLKWCARKGEASPLSQAVFGYSLAGKFDKVKRGGKVYYMDVRLI